MNKKIRLEWLDVAKGIGIFLVMIGHILPKDNYIREIIYTFHMPLFFIISGINFRIIDVKIKKSRLMAQYLTYSFLFLLVDFVLRVCWLHVYEPSKLIWEVYETITLYGINVLWFLATLMLGKKLLFILAKKLTGSEILMLTVLIFMVTSLITKIYNMNTESISILRLAIYFPVMSIIRSLNIMVWVYIGYFYKEKILGIQQYKCINNLLIGVLELTLVCNLAKYCSGVDVHVVQYDNSILAFICGVIGTLAIFHLSNVLCRFQYIKYCLTFWGENTVLMMVLHEYLFVVTITENILNSIERDNVVCKIVLVLLATSLVVLLVKNIINKAEKIVYNLL